MKFVLNILGVILILTSIACNDSDKVENGIKTVHFKDSEIIQQTIEYKNGKRNGCMKEYFRNGKLKAKQYYVNDSLNDSSVVYYPDGKICSLHFYKNKLKHGCWKEFNENGKQYSEIFLKDGKLDSTSTVYSYRSSKVITRVTYKDGVKDGVEEHYYVNGKPSSKTYYDNGAACLGTEEWTDNGKKIDNNFKISITEKDEMLMKNKVTYLIRLENAKPNDKVYKVIVQGKGNKVGVISPLKKSGGVFFLEYDLSKGGFVMEKATIAAYRQTSSKNTFIKLHSFNVALNNY